MNENEITFQIINNFTSIISGKPLANEYRIGGKYNSTNILVRLNKYKKTYKIRNSLNLAMLFTLVNSKTNEYLEKKVFNDEVIELDNTFDGISSIRFLVDTDTTYDNTVLKYYIYDEDEENNYTLPVQQNMYALVPGQEDCFVKKDGQWYERHYSFIGELTGEEIYSINGGRFLYLIQIITDFLQLYIIKIQINYVIILNSIILGM